MATWLSKEEAEHNRVSAQSARIGRALNNSGHPHTEADNSNPTETEAGISSAQPILADHQTAPLSHTMTGGNTREHLDHPVGRTACSEMDEEQKSAAEGRQKNIDVDTQQLPVTMENQRCGETEEEGARMRAAVRKSTRIAARGQRTDYTEVPRYDLPADWAQPYGKAEGVAIAKSRTPGAGYGLYGIKPRTRNSMLFKEAGVSTQRKQTSSPAVRHRPLTLTAFEQLADSFRQTGTQKHYTLIRHSIGITAKSSMITGRWMKTAVKFAGTRKPTVWRSGAWYRYRCIKNWERITAIHTGTGRRMG